MSAASFTLRDPRLDQAEAPYTFFLPDPRRINALDVGDSVKLIFVPTCEGTKWSAEGMWVEILARDGTRYQGSLDNSPEDIPWLSSGDPVEFESWHIIDADFSDKDKNRQHSYPRRDYWDRCIVDRCVLDDDVLVEYVYREGAEPTKDDDKYSDSGWRIRGDYRGLSDDEIDAREVEYVAVGAVLNRDDSWVHLIDEPEGARYLRDWEKNEFTIAAD